MNQQTELSTVPESEGPLTQRIPYAPPKATFVPLKLEERLLACFKHGVGNCPGGKQQS